MGTSLDFTTLLAIPFECQYWWLREEWYQIPICMKFRPAVVYDSPDTGHNVIICGDKREGWVCIPIYGLGDEGGVLLIEGDWF